MEDVTLGEKTIGDAFPCFIIAEAGVNHNGSLKIAKKLVDVACNAKVDAIKFQTYKSEELVTPDAALANYQMKNTGKKQTQLEMLKKLELNHSDFKELKTYCDKKNIVFLSTPHSYDAIDFLDELVPFYKFGSGDLTNLPFIIHAASKNKPIMLGTGMATMKEVKKAVEGIRKKGNNDIVCLHCTTNYPCSFDEVNLRAMITIKEQLDCMVGYSDHSLGLLVPIVAVSMGANVIEKHFTLDKNLEGPDHKASLNPEELKSMVSEIRKVEKILGHRDKKPTNSEKKIKNLVRKSIVAAKNIKRGTILTREMLSIKRPGLGLKPELLESIIGKRTTRNLQKDEIIRVGDVK